ncbi:2,3-butanediol dehydrogenase [Paenibacillus illinoisensis]|uniref:2,3-butanediol dehydrogenase n=1 Tax=Paenibacillus illinoisensis TaxID=59845 RepID=UPI000FDCBC79|nr:2,3-butanediol dehydrogenase [Paenibacillus illinoisensis]
MKAAVWYDRKDIRVEERNIKTLKDTDVLVKVAWAGICGTDLHEYELGPIFMPKDTPNEITGEMGPMVLGHEFSGIVEQVGNNVSTFKKGDKVVVNPVYTPGKLPAEIDRYTGLGSLGLHTDGGFAEYAVVSETNVVQIPDSMPLDKAALVEPLAVAAQAVKDGSVKPGDAVAVFGCGPIGLLTIVAAKAAGAKEIYAFDLSDEKLEKARVVGATQILNTKTGDPVSFIKEKYPFGVDATFEAAGVKATFDASIASTRPTGTAVIVAVHAKNLDFNPVVLMLSGVKMSSSLGYEPETFKDTVRILNDANTNVDPIITKRIKLDDVVEEGFETLLSDMTQAKILIQLSGQL